MFDKRDRLSDKVRLLLFSQCCILKIIADLFKKSLFHKVLSIVFVKNVCSHNAFPPNLRSKLVSGSLQLYVLRLILHQILIFASLLYNKLILTLAVDMIIQTKTGKQKIKIRFRREIFSTRQILIGIFNNASDFASSFLQYNASDFPLKIFKLTDSERSFLHCVRIAI